MYDNTPILLLGYRSKIIGTNRCEHLFETMEECLDFIAEQKIEEYKIYKRIR